MPLAQPRLLSVHPSLFHMPDMGSDGFEPDARVSLCPHQAPRPAECAFAELGRWQVLG